MNIAALGDWLSKQLEGNKQQIPAFPQPLPQRPQPTIQPDVPVPSYRPTADGGYEVFGLQPGQSTFAPKFGIGVLKNPPSGVAYFDPTGQATDDKYPPNYRGRYMAMPMEQLDFQPMPYLQPIGRGF